MKKSIAVLALALALTGSLAACSNRDPNANNTTGSGTTSGSGAVSGTTSGSVATVRLRRTGRPALRQSVCLQRPHL